MGQIQQAAIKVGLTSLGMGVVSWVLVGFGMEMSLKTLERSVQANPHRMRAIGNQIALVTAVGTTVASAVTGTILVATKNGQGDENKLPGDGPEAWLNAQLQRSDLNSDAVFAICERLADIQQPPRVATASQHNA